MSKKEKRKLNKNKKNIKKIRRNEKITWKKIIGRSFKEEKRRRIKEIKIRVRTSWKNRNWIQIEIGSRRKKEIVIIIKIKIRIRKKRNGGKNEEVKDDRRSKEESWKKSKRTWISRKKS